MKRGFILANGVPLLFLLATTASAGDTNKAKQLAYWSFEKVQHLSGDSVSASVVGQPLTSDKGKPAEPQPYVYDETGNGNLIQCNDYMPSPNLFSDDVPVTSIEGRPNTHSLLLKGREYVVPFNRSLPFYDIQQAWNISFSLKCNHLGTEQVYLCKEGTKGSIYADISIGFDPMEQRFFVQVADVDGQPQRLAAGSHVEGGRWYDVYARARYNEKKNETVLEFGVRLSGGQKYSVSTLKYKGLAVRHNAGMWVIGRGYPGGFPNSLSVLDGAIDEVSICGEEKPFKPGQNPLFRDSFTGDPAVTIIGDKAYAYVGADRAGAGGWFNMPEWLCYSSSDMKNWTAHGPVLRAADFPGASPYGAWAAQVVEKDGKYYYYVTLDRKDNGQHMISVAVSDSPTGPFKPARKDGTPLITDDMTPDSHRPNADIDPTVLIDDDGTPWMAWGNGDCYMVKLKKNMIELDGPVKKVPFRNFAEGPWLFKRANLYYNVYAADAPGVQPEQICYATAENIEGPWTFRGYITGPANHGFTIHPSVVEFKGQWYFFYHDGSYPLDGTPGGDCRRHVCVEYLYFNPDGTIQPIKLTTEGISVKPARK